MNVLAATGVALGYDVPLDAIVDRAATLTTAPRRGEVTRLAKGVVLVDDSYNSSPAALARALDAVGSDAEAVRRVAVIGEMRELGEFATVLHRESGRRAVAAGVDLLVAIGGAPAEALAERRRRRRSRRGGRPALRDQRRGGRAGRGDAPRRRRRAREGLARHTHRHRRGPREGGVGLMLYHLLFPLHTSFSVLNVTRYITFRTAAAEPDGAGHQPAAGPVADSQAARVPGRPGHSTGGPRDAPHQGRHADDGRPADPGGVARADAALGGSHQHLHLDCRAGDRWASAPSASPTTT